MQIALSVRPTLFRVIRPAWLARLIWEPRDLWVGAHWDRSTWHEMNVETGGERVWDRTNLYICLLPCLPLHLSWWSERPQTPTEPNPLPLVRTGQGDFTHDYTPEL